MPQQSVTINGGGQNVATGSYYLYHYTNSLSLLYQFKQVLLAGGVTSATCVLLKSGLVKITGSGTFTVTWAVGSLLPDLLGFTGGNLSGASSYTAPEYSTLFWSPGWPETPSDQTPVGALGWEVSDTVVGTSADGFMEFASNNLRYHNDFSWFSVTRERTYTRLEPPGEYLCLWKNVLRKGYQWFLYSGIVEDRAISDNATYTGSIAMGPYKLRPSGTPLVPGCRRQRANMDTLWDVSIPAQLVDEYS